MSITFVDRSRYTKGLGECMFAEYLGYYYEYTGVVPKKFSIPLSTGGQVHAALEYILYYLQDNNLELPDEIVREYIKTAQEAYVDEVDQSTWSHFDSEEILDYIIKEQTTLLEGLIWCWVECLVPWIRKYYEIVSIEKEYELMLACTCGLGTVGKAKDHNDKNCNGTCLMTRPDLVLKNKITGNFAYIEFKTGAYVNSADYPLSFEDNVQFVLGARAVERALDKSVTELFVHGFHKGARKWNDEKTLKHQLSALCYAYVKEPNLPFEKGDISPEYYKTILQKDGTYKKWGCSENRGYTKKFPVWKFEFSNLEEGMTNIEHYVKNIMTKEQRQDNIRLIGPIDNSAFLSEKLIKQMIHEESRWKDRLDLIEATVEKSGGWNTNETIEITEELIPRSWNCKKYGEEFMCAYKPYCYEQLTESLLESDKYERRLPNHPVEQEIGRFYNKGFSV